MGRVKQKKKSSFSWHPLGDRPGKVGKTRKQAHSAANQLTGRQKSNFFGGLSSSLSFVTFSLFLSLPPPCICSPSLSQDRTCSFRDPSPSFSFPSRFISLFYFPTENPLSTAGRFFHRGSTFFLPYYKIHTGGDLVVGSMKIPWSYSPNVSALKCFLRKRFSADAPFTSLWYRMILFPYQVIICMQNMLLSSRVWWLSPTLDTVFLVPDIHDTHLGILLSMNVNFVRHSAWNDFVSTNLLFFSLR